MSLSEQDAKTVLEIMSYADGGCPSCVADLYALFLERFPEFKELVARQLPMKKWYE